MATPSIAMIPSAVKAGKVYSVLPTPVYGEELVVNGDFATDSDWSKNAGATISGGKANIIGDGTIFTNISQPGIFTSGKQYKVTVDVIINSGLGLKFQDLANNENIGFATTSGAYSFIFIATADSSLVIGRRVGGTAFNSSIDNVSVKEALTANADFDFTRASTATRINSKGLIESVASNVPRLDYSNGDCPSLLLEPQSTNLIPYSEDFSNSSWSKADITVSSDVVISPEGTLKADEIIEGVANSEHYVFKVVTIPDNTDYTISCFFKKGISNDYVYLRGRAKSGSNVRAWFNISNGTLGTVDSGAVAKIKDFNNGWFKCSITINVLTGGSSVLALLGLADNDNSFAYLGDGVSSSYFWGAQAEENSYPTSYIPTSGTTQTRVAETCGGAGDASSINSEEGVLYAEISALSNDGTSRRLAISDGTNSNRLFLAYTSTSNELIAVSISNNVTSVLISKSINVLQINKIAFKYKENDFALWVNGVKLGVDTSANTPIGINTLRLEDGNGSNPFYGNTKDLRVYNTALTDFELLGITSPILYPSFNEMATELNFNLI